MDIQHAQIAKNEVTVSNKSAPMLADNFNTDGSLKNIRHELWCQIWVSGFNEMEACNEAGYQLKVEQNPQYHKQLRARLMRKPHVQLRVKNLIKERVAHLGIDENWVIMNVVSVMNQSIGGTEVLDREGNPTGVWTHDSRGALKALEMLGSNIGMFQKKEKTREVHLNLNFGGGQPQQKISVDVDTGFSEQHQVIDVEPMGLD
jgi:hypothetical protein